MSAPFRGGPWAVATSLIVMLSSPTRATDAVTTEEKNEEIRKSLDQLASMGIRLLPKPAPKAAAVDTDPQAAAATRLAEAVEAIRAYSKAVDDANNKRKGLGGKIQFGGGSDESTSADKSKVKVGAELTLGSYPGQLRLKFEGAVDQDASVVKEEVTSMLANYDYYITPGREVHGFIERFTDSFLDIGQRYEIGLGMRFELTRDASYEEKEWFEDYKPLTSAKPFDLEDCKKAYTDKGCKAMDDLIKAQTAATAAVPVVSERAALDPDFKSAAQPILDHASSLDLSDILNGQRKAHTKWELAFSIGALAEYESPLGLKRNVQTLEDGDTDNDGIPGEVLSTEARTFSQPSSQRFRLSLKPSALLRLGQRTELFLKAYYKPALDSPRRVNGVQDWRADLYAGLKWDLPSMTKKDSSTTISLNYELHYDNLPPQATPILDALERLDPDGLDPVSAKRHRMVKLAVEIPL